MRSHKRANPVLLKRTDLASHLQNQLAQVYLVSGDDFFLVQESCDAIIAAARTKGFQEKSFLDTSSGFRWQDLGQNAASMSLFSQSRILDVRVAGNKFDKDASKAIREYVNRPIEDTLLLIRCSRLEPKQRSSAWYKAIDSIGYITLTWPIEGKSLFEWLKRRANVAGLNLDNEAIRYLMDRVEGNLLAGAQEIEKLKLIAGPDLMTVEDVESLIGDFAHYDVFSLIDAIFGGDLARVHRILNSLHDAGVSLFPILGGLTGQMRRLKDSKRPIAGKRGELIAVFIKRLGSVEVIDKVLDQCALVDAQAKGQLLGDSWGSLENLCLRLAGSRKLLSLEVQAKMLRL